jgi:hypothetical protein
MHPDWKKIALGILCVAILVALYLVYANRRTAPQSGDSMLEKYSTTEKTGLDSGKLGSYTAPSDQTIDAELLDNYSVPQ